MHTDLELKLPKQFKMYVDKEEVYDYPNTNKCSKSMVRVFWLISEALNRISLLIFSFIQPEKPVEQIQGHLREQQRSQLAYHVAEQGLHIDQFGWQRHFERTTQTEEQVSGNEKKTLLFAAIKAIRTSLLIHQLNTST